MSNKIQKPEDCYTGRDFEGYARDHGAKVKKVGSYKEVSTDNGWAYVPDTDRTLLKPTRELLVKLLKVLLSGAFVIVCIAAYWYANYGM